MWIFSTGGFISAVSHRDDDTKTMIRARDRMSLEEFLSSVHKGFVEAGKTEDEATAMMEPGKDGMWNIYAVIGDYKWRVVVPKSALGVGLAYEATHYVNYSNFKSKLTATRGDKWHDVAMKVWSAMFGIEDRGVKTGNPDVDNPRPYEGYHSKYTGKDYYATYPAPKGKSGLPKSDSANPNPTEGTASGSETDWVDDALGAGYYDKKWEDDHEHGALLEVDEGRSYRWGGNGLFEEDLEGFEDPDELEWKKGLHGFNGEDPFRVDGRGEIVGGKFIGSSFFDEDASDTPSDAELLAVEEAIASSWESWDEEHEYNTITGEQRRKAVNENALFDADHKFAGSVHSMTDAEWNAMQLAEGYSEQS